MLDVAFTRCSLTNFHAHRLVPEFNFMDPRAIGGWDFGALNATEAAVWALDADEAGTYGKDGKPPSNEGERRRGARAR